MPVTVTPAAAGLIRRSLELAKLDPADAGVRLRLAGGAVRPRFATAPEPDDEIVDLDGVRLFVDRALVTGDDVTVDVSDEHEQLVITPSPTG